MSTRLGDGARKEPLEGRVEVRGDTLDWGAVERRAGEGATGQVRQLEGE